MVIYTVTELTKYIKRIVNTDPVLASVCVRGEISNFKHHSSGHCYFTLKDAGASIRSVMFRSRAQFLKFAPRDGLKVMACGRIDIFERDGQYQLYVDELVPAGLGELSLAYEQLKAKLAAEGLFDESRKQALPVLPRTVGVITSPTGAALRDIFTVAKRRFAGISLVLYPVQVQGDEAPLQIVHAIETFNRLKNVDVLIVGRGGGSIEELWAFNDERVVRAVAASRLPIVSAVGHQTDYTLSDFAADRRAATPSQAAEIVVPAAAELDRYIRTLATALTHHLRRDIGQLKAQVEQLQQSRALRRPLDLLAAKAQTVDMLSQQLARIMRQFLLNRQYEFKVSAEKLAMLNPLSVLARGYSIAETPDGRVVSCVDDTEVGDPLQIILRDGRLNVSVESRMEEEHLAQKE